MIFDQVARRTVSFGIALVFYRRQDIGRTIVRGYAVKYGLGSSVRGNVRGLRYGFLSEDMISRYSYTTALTTGSCSTMSANCNCKDVTSIRYRTTFGDEHPIVWLLLALKQDQAPKGTAEGFMVHLVPGLGTIGQINMLCGERLH